MRFFRDGNVRTGRQPPSASDILRHPVFRPFAAPIATSASEHGESGLPGAALLTAESRQGLRRHSDSSSATPGGTAKWASNQERKAAMTDAITRMPDGASSAQTPAASAAQPAADNRKEVKRRGLIKGIGGLAGAAIAFGA